METKVINFKALDEKIDSSRAGRLQRFADLKEAQDYILSKTEFESIAKLAQALNGSPFTGQTELGQIFKIVYDELAQVHTPVDGLIKSSSRQNGKMITLALGIVDDVITFMDSSTFVKSAR